MGSNLRLDAALVERGLCTGRDKAKRIIADGHVSVNGKTVKKASASVSDADEIVCGVKERFVGRGGEKLLKVIEELPLNVEGYCCVDIGASTGGFTDCLLQHGAKTVFAVDVGHDQLALSLRENPHVVSLEGTDIRNRERIKQHIADGSVDLCVIDVSFISLTQIWDSVMPLLKADGRIVCLIKPQFEAGRAALSKRGIVKNKKDHVRVIETLLRFWQEKAMSPLYLSWSPVCGGEGNIEYLAVLSANETVCTGDRAATVVKGAFAALRP